MRRRPRRVAPVAERFWRYVERREDDGCWIWTGKVDSSGYGCLNINGKWVRASRLAWEIITGSPIPKGLLALHRCDVRRCVRADLDPRVSHIFLGTHAENMADMVRKGRSDDRAGMLNPFARLSDAAILELRRRYAAGGITQQALADEYGTSQCNVSKIVLGVSWAHVSEAARAD